MKLSINSIFIAILAFSISFFTMADQVNIYSGRQEALIKPLLDKFSEQTGITVNLVTGKADALIQRAKSEGEFSEVDLLIMADAGRLYRAKSMQLTQSIEQSLDNVPAGFVDEDKHWVALTKRARSIMVNKADQGELPESMLMLAEPEFKGQICVRSSSNIYNQSMTAAMILQKGQETASKWATGIAQNMARTPKGGDRDQIRAMVAGECRFAIANTYYLGGMLTSQDDQTKEIANQVKMLWSPESAGGTHINISGAAIAKHAPNKAAAEKLIAFMLSPEQQQWYAQVNQEYPLLDTVKWSDDLNNLGNFTPQLVDFNQMGKLNGEALRLMDKAGWR